MTADAVVRSFQQPAEALRLLDKLDAEERLLDFMRHGWHALEPSTPLVVGWALEAVCEHLEAVTRGQVRRLLINVPPGFSKSMSANVFWPAWEWGPRNLAHHRFISAAHELSLSTRDMVRCRDLALSEWYQSCWGERWQFKGDSNAKIEYHTTATGWRKASSTGSGLTGWRGHRIVLDDPHAVRDMESEAVREEALRWFSETLPTRLNDQARDAIVVIMQRVHERDVSGLILAKELGYEHLCLPMEYEPRHRCYTAVPRRDGVPPQKVRRLKREGEPLPRWVDEPQLADEVVARPLGPDDRLGEPRELYPWDLRAEDGELLCPERFPAHAVEELKAAFRAWGGTYAEAGQLQQRPAPRGGGMFQRKDFQYLDVAPAGVQWVRGWDLVGTAGKRSPYTVGVKMGVSQGRVVIADVVRAKTTPGQLEEMLLATTHQDGRPVWQDLPQDPGQAGKYQRVSLVQLLNGYVVHSSPETGSKEDRAKPLAAQAEGGNLYLVRGPWNDAFVAEACLFPNGEFKDQIDAASRAHQRLTLQPARRGIVAPVLLSASG